MKRVAYLSALMIFLSFAANAQWNGRHHGGGAASAPVDGGLSILLVAGATGYGVKKYVEHKKKKAAK